MKIVVTVKHVPETGAVVLDEETGTMKRDGVESIPNPLDLYAVEVALRLREHYGGTITALSMGPAGAERSLREVIAMGCDDAVLLTGREFAGSDTLATSRALAKAVERLGGCDLLLLGERATDGDTGQVGPGTAALLDYPLAAYVSGVEGVETVNEGPPPHEQTSAGQSEGSTTETSSGEMSRIVVERLTEEGYERLALRLPAALTIIKEAATPRLPTLRGKQRARTAPVVRWTGSDLGLEPGRSGLAGSPTRVERIFHPRIARDGEILSVTGEEALEQTAERLAGFILSHLPAIAGGALPAAPQDHDDLFGRPAGSPATASEAGSSDPASTAAPNRSGREIWAVAETRSGRISEITWELLARARPLADRSGSCLSVVLAADHSAASDIEGLFARGADRVYQLLDPSLEHFIVETRSRLLERLAREVRPVAIIAAATTSGRSLMPQLAVRLETGLTADCTELDIDRETGSLLQTRPAIGGNIMATIRTPQTTPSMATVRPHSVPPAAPYRAGEGELITVPFTPIPGEPRVRHLSLRPVPDASVALQDARVIVSCGRGFQKREKLELAGRLAEVLGASVGASREAVDRGWIGYPHQVGLSGKTVSPELYIAIGISGAVQHLAGIKTAKTIVAVNNDPDAPIFHIADFGVVGDLFALVPLLIEKLRSRVGRREGEVHA